MTKRQKHKSKPKRKINAVLTVGVIALFIGVAFLLITSFTGLDSVSNASTAEVAPSFTLASLTGESVTVPDMDRQATVIFAMAYWCGTCIPEARALAQLKSEYGDVVRIVAVDIDPSSTPDLLQQFIQVIGPNNLTWAFDSDGSFSRTYGIRALDTTIILDGDGREIYRDGYPTSYEVLRDQLERIIKI
jgi:thiol-disulfide isomerase/thioredoxin